MGCGVRGTARSPLARQASSQIRTVSQLPTTRWSRIHPMAETAFQTITIDAPMDKVYGIAADFESYPDWAKDVKEATVRARDDQGRPTEVEFRASALGRSTHYTLSYDYSEAPKVLEIG